MVLKHLIIISLIGLCVSAGLDLKQYRQPDDVLDGSYDVLRKAEGTNLCTRLCDGIPKTCYYEFFVEPYTAMGPACGDCPRNFTACSNPQCVTADGVEKHILTYNRRLPGPSIQVCVNDTIVVDVHNKLKEGGTTIHWHGIRQKGTQYYDGVAKVTQCPITADNTFRYTFKATEAGTYFYHSHVGLQKVDGLSGSLVIRQEISEEFYGNLYDYDLPSHVMFINDWMHIGAYEKIPGFRLKNTGQSPRSYLINGRGVYVPFNKTVTEVVKTPLAEFRVRQGKTYRFRLVGSTCLSCTVSVHFHGHRLTLINADSGGPITPTDVDTVTLNSGDRFDVLLTANQSLDSYWIQVRGNGDCQRAQQFAVLRYHGHATGRPSAPFPGGIQSINTGKILNPLNSFCNKTSDVCLSQLKSPKRNELKEVTSKESFFIEFNFYSYTPEQLFQTNTYNEYFEPLVPLLFKSTINNISNAFPPSPLLSQYNDIPESAFCPEECYQQVDTRKSCSCLNLIKLSLYSEVTIIIVDFATSYSPHGLQHPFHLHGYNFYILEEGIFKGSRKEGIQELKRRVEEDDFDNNFAIEKDTVGVPTYGYVVVRFYADNPGFWFLHCHYTYHLDTGMNAVVQVGELDDLPPVPEGFPKCSNFQPSLNAPL